MANKDQYKADDFIKAIPGTGGIITTIARKVGCDWNTAKKYITGYATVKSAYEAECESNSDVAESVLINNIKAANSLQSKHIQRAQDAEKTGDHITAAIEYQRGIVDTGDAKWWLSRKGQGRGFADKQEITGAEGGPLVVEYVNDWRNQNNHEE